MKMDFGSLTPEMAYALGRILGAWKVLKASQCDSRVLVTVPLRCCKQTTDLFEALQLYENLMNKERPVKT